MITLLAVLAVLAVVFGVAVVLTGRAEVLSDEGRDLADTGIPRSRAMTPQDVIGLRFALAFRGYRMDEVDDALDRLAAEIAARDEAIERLRGTSGTSGPEGAAEAAVEAAGEAGPWAGYEREVAAAVAGSPDDAVPDAGSARWADPGVPADPWVAPPVEVAAAPVVEGGAARAFEAVLAAGAAHAAAPPAEAANEETTDDPAEPAAPVLADHDTAAWNPPAAPDPWTVQADEDDVAEAAPANPFRPDVPDIPTYDPWAVTPRSRYTDGPTYVEVEQAADPDEVADSVTEHQTGYALPPPASDTDTDTDTDDEQR